MATAHMASERCRALALASPCPSARSAVRGPRTLPNAFGHTRAPPIRASASSVTPSTTLGGASSARADHPPRPPVSELGWSRGLDSHYALGSFIGSGSYGVIHHATGLVDGQPYAIKCLAKERPNAPRARTLKRIAREASLMERLHGCPSVVQLVDKFEEHDAAYFVMELATGKDLSVLLQERETLPEPIVARIVYECLTVLQACHAANVVHADIKPANLLVDLDTLEGPCASGWAGPCAPERPLVKLLDFGCSQAYVPNTPLTRRTGTPIYMAPEVYRKAYTPSADVWSLGVMLFQLVSGQFPFWESMRACLDSSIDEVMSAILHKPLHGAHLDGAGVSPECIALVMAMLQRDPARRITVQEALQHPWFAMHAAPADCGCEAPASNIVVFEPERARVRERGGESEVAMSALGIWAMMQGALRGHPVV